MFQPVKSKGTESTDTVTEEMLDEDLKEDELSDGEEPPTVPDIEQEDTQPSNISNKFVFFEIYKILLSRLFYMKYLILYGFTFALLQICLGCLPE